MLKKKQIHIEDLKNLSSENEQVVVDFSEDALDKNTDYEISKEELFESAQIQLNALEEKHLRESYNEFTS